MKRILSLLLTLLLLITSLPVNAFVALAEGIVAEEAAEVEIPLGNFAIGAKESTFTVLTLAICERNWMHSKFSTFSNPLSDFK